MQIYPDELSNTNNYFNNNNKNKNNILSVNHNILSKLVISWHLHRANAVPIEAVPIATTPTVTLNIIFLASTGVFAITISATALYYVIPS